MGGVTGIGRVDAVVGLGTSCAVTAAIAVPMSSTAAIAAVTIAPAATIATATAASTPTTTAATTAGCPGESAAEIRTGEAWLHDQGAGQHDGEARKTQRG
jgi:hypothetical protein